MQKQRKANVKKKKKFLVREDACRDVSKVPKLKGISSHKPYKNLSSLQTKF